MPCSKVCASKIYNKTVVITLGEDEPILGTVMYNKSLLVSHHLLPEMRRTNNKVMCIFQAVVMQLSIVNKLILNKTKGNQLDEISCK